jgi:hypothetical protein
MVCSITDAAITLNLTIPGPIVLISPHEIHIDDPDFYQTLYSVSSKLEKDPRFYAMIAAPDAAVNTVHNKLHRLRRGAFEHAFSRQSIARLDPYLRSQVQELCRKMKLLGSRGEPCDISSAYRSVTAEIIHEYALNVSLDLLNSPDLGKGFHKSIFTMAEITLYLRFFKFLALLIDMPRRLVATLLPRMGQVIDYRNVSC